MGVAVPRRSPAALLDVRMKRADAWALGVGVGIVVANRFVQDGTKQL